MLQFRLTRADRFDWLYASIDTRFGKVSSKWYHFEGRIRYEITMPSPAVVHIEDKVYNVTPGTYIF
ncbi:MAG: hypothetical protein GX303_05650 [Clostridiales bacterium]|nr:hypothetical protein [Clostridiales bacterium]